LARLELELAGLELKQKAGALGLGAGLAAAVIGLVARAKISRGSPPVPRQAIREAKLTTETLRADGRD